MYTGWDPNLAFNGKVVVLANTNRWKKGKHTSDARMVVARKKLKEGNYTYSLLKARNKAFEGTRLYFGD